MSGTLLRPASLTQRAIFLFWLPLAGMWFLMAVEFPTINAILGRMPEVKVQLASFGIAFGLALMVESPVIMLLVAGTALASGRRAYRRLVAFTTVLAIGLTGLHLLVAHPSLFRWIVGKGMDAEANLIEPARMAFLWMLPWTGMIAFRRFWQGVMIGHGAPGATLEVSAIRLVCGLSALAIGYAWRLLPGASLAAMTLAVGVTAGAVAAFFLTRGIVRREILPDEGEPLPWDRLLRFYGPLALTSMIALCSPPLISAGLGRGRLEVDSLALWPVIWAFSFLFRSPAMAYQEGVVALLGRPDARRALEIFTRRLALGLSVAFGCVMATPLGALFFRYAYRFDDAMVGLALFPMLMMIPFPALGVLQSWYRGILVHAKRTRPIGIGGGIYVLTVFGSLIVFVRTFDVPGVWLAPVSVVVALLVELAYLGWHARRADAGLSAETPSGTEFPVETAGTEPA